MSTTKKLLNGGFWNLIETVGLTTLNLGFVSIMARLLSKVDFGLMAIVTSIMGLGLIVVDGGMGAALIQKTNISDRHKNAALFGSVFLGLGVSVFVFFLAGPISKFFNEPRLNLILRVVAVNVFLLSVSSVSLSLIYKSFKFKQAAVITILTTTFGCLFGVLLGLNGFGVWSLVGANLLTTGTKALVLFFVSPIKFRFGWYFEELKELFGFGFGVFLLKLSNYISNAGLILALGKVFQTHILGVFDRGFQIKSLPSKYLGGIIDRVMFPVMSEIQDQDERLFKMFYFGLGLSKSILIPASFYFVYYSKAIVLVLLGSGWGEVVLPLQIMFVVLPFNMSSQLADSVFRAKGTLYKNALRKYIYVAVLLFLAVVLGGIYGMLGAALAVAISGLINYLLMIILIKQMFLKRLRDLVYHPLKDSIFLTLCVCFVLFLSHVIGLICCKGVVFEFVVGSVMVCVLFCFVLFKKPRLAGSFVYGVVSKYLQDPK